MAGKQTRDVQSIVVGIDASPRSDDAMAFASRVARLLGARLVLVDVYSLAGAGDDFTGGTLLARAESWAAERTLAEAREAAGDDLDIAIRPIAGESAAETLQEIAEQERAGMVVLGSTHVGRLGRVLPGSTAERLLEGSPCPVAAVPSGYAARPAGAIARVGVATDQSAQARLALEDATLLARTTRAELRIMTAVALAWNWTAELLSGPGGAELRDDLAARVRADLDATVAATPDDVDAVGIVLEGDLTEQLTYQSRRLDVLFMGSRALGPLHSALVGGVSGRVLREAHCPVVVTPPSSLRRLVLDGPAQRPEAPAPASPEGFELLLRFLGDHGIECAVTEHAETFTAAAESRAAAVPADRTAKAVMLRDAAGYLLALVPASRRLDLDKLRRLTARPGLDLAPEAAIAADFPQFEVGALPPFGALFGASEVIDDRLLATRRVLCNGGDHRHSIVIDVHDLAIASRAQTGDLVE